MSERMGPMAADFEILRALQIRFYGRFVFVFNETAGTMTALAVNLQKNPRVNAPRHHVFFNALERNVCLGDPRHDFAPTYRIIGTDVVPPEYEGARDIWNIANCFIDIPGGKGAFNWDSETTGPAIADLGNMSSGGVVNNDYLAETIPPESAVTAAIRLHAGVATVKDLSEKRIDYSYTTFGSPKTIVRAAGELGDMVEVVVPRDDDGEVELAVTHQQSKPKPIVVAPKPLRPGVAFNWPLVLSFSNLCTTSPHGGPDLEFAGFYEVLANATDLDIDSRLIPTSDSDQGGSQTASHPLAKNCHSLINARQPFGDCFLGAMIKI
jgi:hypothetical protein